VYYVGIRTYIRFLIVFDLVYIKFFFVIPISYRSFTIFRILSFIIDIGSRHVPNLYIIGTFSDGFSLPKVVLGRWSTSILLNFFFYYTLLGSRSHHVELKNTKNIPKNKLNLFLPPIC